MTKRFSHNSAQSVCVHPNRARYNRGVHTVGPCSVRGFSTLEIMIAMAILALTMGAVLLITYGSQSLGSDSAINSEALAKTQALIETEQALARKDFNLVNSTTTTEFDDPITYTKQVTVTTEPDYLTKQITAKVLWNGSYGRMGQYVQLSSLITNYANAIGGDTCDSNLTGDWAHPLHSDYQLSASGLLSGGAPAGHMFSSTNPVGALDIDHNVLYVGVAATASNQDDSLLMFSTAASPSAPTYLGSIDTATSTVVGPAAIAVAGRYAYIANAYPADFGTCINPDDLSTQSTTYASACAQLQVIDVHDPAHAVLKYNFKVPNTSGNGGQSVGKSIAYNDGYIYMGLTKAGSGTEAEFHIIDVHNPLFPAERGSFIIGRTVNAITIRNGYAYLATDDNARELTVLDISNPYAPVLASGAPFDPPGPAGFGYGKSLFAVGDWLFLGRTFVSGADELYALSITDPSHAMPTPSVGQSFSIPSSVVGVIVRTSLAFVLTSTTNVVQLLNVGSPTQISAVSSIPMPGNGVGLTCEGNFLYAGTTSGTTGYISIVKPS